ncbi:MAG: hypothetical protein COV34_03465 [Candidatus Zambryskibacteria bacterium CG10_big_fil_rev_8_21_14_0_10_42_12]|uniref:Bacterial type II secretion system protein E domain-containing protein n=1 Tax=Candidatus Zambryskibacteria bacterium CG10_big_fil_rev_8_21_14_0_10_42_12 TaxID=1975115 RepID=A0A2H0QSM9_9BACT|nr:MAG: hypothetical protein COV34_03465 [Candidatus Zambryskibacteria bacterium CG10_big_fil_rev_8_21_14_0_10_42_12]
MVINFNEDRQSQRISELRRREEENLTKMLAHKYNLPYLDLSQAPVNIDALRIIPEKTSREAFIVALDETDKRVQIAILTPANEKTKEVLQNLEQRRYIPEVFMVSKSSLEHVWKRYSELSYASETKGGAIDISSDQITDLVANVKKFEDIITLIDQTLKEKKSYRISRILEIIVAGAIALNASDVHIEPEEDYVRLRYRLDGTLTNVLNFDFDTYKLLGSRIKLISNLKLNIKDEAQDGRFSINLDDMDIEVRTSVLPGAYAESIVLRILNPNNIAVSLDELGINNKLLEVMKREISKPNGMILTTGPTGSGKTTTLYAFLKTVHEPGVKIITIEDPIEYHLPGIVQTQADKDGEYTFANGLRSSLRQDPDVIMIGEIRDSETARIAVNAALTGHIVFSTLHTNTAAGTFPRLIDLGVDSKIISSALNLAIAQRLVRKLCPHCKKQVVPDEKTKARIQTVLVGITDKTYIEGVQREHIWEPVGCPECNNIGYKGRIGVFEAIIADETLEKLLTSYPSEREIFEGTRHQNLLSMAEDGVIKILQGVTSLAELERVVEIE